MNYEELCAMQLHEERDLDQFVDHITVLRVPGGWIYTTTYEVWREGENLDTKISQCFVPQPKELKP